MTVFYGPTGRLRDADREREIVTMALAAACGFEYYAPNELTYVGDGPDWWSIFWSAVERQYYQTRFCTLEYPSLSQTPDRDE